MTGISDAAPAQPNDEELMREYGIERVPAERFHYKTYRYSLLADAVRQAQRDRRDATPVPQNRTREIIKWH